MRDAGYWGLVFGKSKDFALFVPGIRKRQQAADAFERQVDRLHAFENLVDNVRSEVGEGQESADLVAVFIVVAG